MHTNSTNQQQILLVDDMPENLKVLRKILVRHNYLVRIAINGRLALLSAHQEPPDLILLDIRMPEMDGFEVCQRLKADDKTRNIPVLFLSALDDIENKIRAFEQGGADYITKPFQMREILARIKTHLDLKTLQARLETQNAELKKEIHLRKQSEKQLRESEKKLKDSQTIACLGQWDLNLKTDSLFWSDEIYRIFDMDPDRLEPAYGAFIEAVHPEDREFVQAAITDSLKTQKNYDIVHRLLMRDGTTKWVKDNCRAEYDPDGDPLRVIGTVQDITQIKETEESLRAANEKLKAHVKEMSLLNRISEIMTSTLSFQKALKIIICEIGELLNAYGGSFVLIEEETLERKVVAHYNKSDADAVDLTGRMIPSMPIDASILNENKSIIITDAQENPRVKPIHDLMRLRGVHHLMIVPLRVPEKVIGAIIFSTNSKDHEFTQGQMDLVKTIAGQISGAIENARLYQKAKDARAEAEKANSAKSDFLANMSHEIRTPMNAVLGFLELTLDDSLLTATAQSNLKTAHKSARSLLDLLNDILDLSKLESGKITLEERPFDLTAMVREIMQFLEIKADEKRLALSVNIDPKVSPCYIGDSARLRQILINLIGNAIKFTPKGSVQINIAPWSEVDMLHFTISDTGVGIAPERLKGIFDPFTQADSSTSRRFGGTGLGTTISKQLTELMGGRIWAESQEGRGSTFEFTVRMKATELPPEPSFQQPQPKLDHFSPSRRSLRILLVEDVEENIRLMQMALERRGHAITPARNGREAVEIFTTDNNFDAVLMDVHMPKMDGLEATRQIRALERAAQTGPQDFIPIVALTASLMKAEKEACQEAGMNALVGKPIDFDELFKTLEQAIATQENQPSKFENPSLSDIHFPIPKLEGVDIRKGLKRWGDAAEYSQALARFSYDYGDSHATIARLLAQGDLNGANDVVHALKGVSGNLALTDVYELAQGINANIKANRLKDANALIRDLENAFNAFSADVRQLEQKERKRDQEFDQKPFEPGTVRQDIQNMIHALDQYNPAAVAPFLSKLAEYLPSSQVNLIKQQVARFNFKGAKQETLKLAQSLAIELTLTTDGERKK